MKALVICNDPPYGSGRSWNGLRLAGVLARRDVHQQAQLAGAGALLVFDEGGITGHPGHRQATAASGRSGVAPAELTGWAARQ